MSESQFESCGIHVAPPAREKLQEDGSVDLVALNRVAGAAAMTSLGGVVSDLHGGEIESRNLDGLPGKLYDSPEASHSFYVPR